MEGGIYFTSPFPNAAFKRGYTVTKGSTGVKIDLQRVKSDLPTIRIGDGVFDAFVSTVI